MSISKLTLSASLVLLLSVSFLAQNCHGQDCNCDQSGRTVHAGRVGFGIPALGLGGCGSPQAGCKSGCNQNCVSANDLWSGFAANADCRGCVRCNRLRPQLPGFGGQPLSINGCRSQGCHNGCADAGTTPCRSGLGLPTLSVPMISSHWPRPLHLPGAACNSLQPKLQDVFNVFGAARQRNVRCDIQNDCFGKLGESRQQSAPQPLPSTEAQPTTEQSAPVIDREENIPPAPVVEPLQPTTAVPAFDNASRLEYGQKTWSR